LFYLYWPLLGLIDLGEQANRGGGWPRAGQRQRDERGALAEGAPTVWGQAGWRGSIGGHKRNQREKYVSVIHISPAENLRKAGVVAGSWHV